MNFRESQISNAKIGCPEYSEILKLLIRIRFSGKGSLQKPDCVYDKINYVSTPPARGAQRRAIDANQPRLNESAEFAKFG